MSLGAKSGLIAGGAGVPSNSFPRSRVGTPRGSLLAIAPDMHSHGGPWERETEDRGNERIAQLKQYCVHFLLLRLRLSALQSLDLSGCHRQTRLGVPWLYLSYYHSPNEFGAGTSGLVLAPTTMSELTQFHLKCSTPDSSAE